MFIHTRTTTYCFVGIDSDNKTHFTFDHHNYIPVFSRKTEINQTWSFWNDDDVKYYTQGIEGKEIYQYYWLFDPEIKTIKS